MERQHILWGGLPLSSLRKNKEKQICRRIGISFLAPVFETEAGVLVRAQGKARQLLLKHMLVGDRVMAMALLWIEVMI